MDSFFAALEMLQTVFWFLLNNWPLLLLALSVGFTSKRSFDEVFAKKEKTVSDALHNLRDEGAKSFVACLERKLKQAAASGRSDYEFHFRQYDVWFEMRTVLYILTLPYPRRFWDCIDSPGSRLVIKKMLEGEGNGLRVDWCVSMAYSEKKAFAPKWVLSCKWDKLELRTSQYGGRTY